jgi:hypothetical protein
MHMPRKGLVRLVSGTLLGRGVIAGYRGGITVCTYADDTVSGKAGAGGCELSLSFRDTFSRKHQVRISVPMHAITATRAHQGYV